MTHACPTRRSAELGITLSSRRSPKSVLSYSLAPALWPLRLFPIVHHVVGFKKSNRAPFFSFNFNAPQCQLCQAARSEEHTFELQSLMRNSYAVFCLPQTIHHHTLYIYINTS